MDGTLELTELARVFLTPSNSTHRQYEALRAFFVDRIPGAEAAKRFGYTTGSFRALVHQFRQNPDRHFFVTPKLGRSPGVTDPVGDQIVALRKQNMSVYDISEALKKEDIRRSPVAVGEVLKKEGFAKLTLDFGLFGRSTAACFSSCRRWHRGISLA